MAHWLVKTEPGCYNFNELLREKRTVWDGVTNPQALIFLREMKRGDDVLFYHTGKEKSVVGLARVESGPYPDPNADNEKLVVVDIEAVKAVPEPVTLKAIKADKAFADFHLVRNSRLSVMPVPKNLWQKLLRMGEAG